MAERKWGAITSGATFESLAKTIVAFEDPNPVLFGRRGKDGGQDARSGDGTRVFQVKHHTDGSAAKAIADAKAEAVKIRDYRQPGHARHDQWRGVTHWRLVTNAAFNPADKLRWDTEVAPIFAEQGLTADYWERANLDALLDKHPEIHRSYFDNETRAFLTVPELRERLPSQEPFLRRDDLGAFCGRATELAAIRVFLESSELFLVLHGAGGIGKTRLLVEAGEASAEQGEWQVLWANVASMSATGAWFEAVVPERRTLLLVDEPPDEELLRQLTEQLGGRVGRMAHWKIAVAVRSPNDPVLRFLRGPRMRPTVRELAIDALQAQDAEAMCSDLLSKGPLATRPPEQRSEAARDLARQFHRHPIWLTLAVHLLESRGDLKMVPATAKELANEYLSEVEQGQNTWPPGQIRNILRWVALLGTVNREDDATLRLIGDASGAGDVTDVRSMLSDLVARRVLLARGVHKRLLELKPDVLRDHLLLSWLSVDVGFGDNPLVASPDATELSEGVRRALVAGSLSDLGRATLVSLGRTEFLFGLSGHRVPLLSDLFAQLQAAAPTLAASRRLALAEALEAVAGFSPAATAGVIRAMRQSTAPSETVEDLFEPRVVGQDEVLLALAWPLFAAAMGSQTAEVGEVVLRELCAVAEAEGDLAPRLTRGLPNDGRRAAALVVRVIEGGPQYWVNFDEIARRLGEELLTDLSRRAPTPGRSALLRALVHPALAVERSQTWSDDNAVHIRSFAIRSDHPAWAARNSLLQRVRQALSADATPIASRVALWKLFANAHHGVNQQWRDEKATEPAHKDELRANLAWARNVLANRGAALQELSAARELWAWHHQFESDAELNQASEELERLYVTNDLASEFEPLLSREDWEQRGTRAAAKAAELSVALEPDIVGAFLDRAVAFLGDEEELRQLTEVAWALGKHTDETAVLQAFVKRCLANTAVTPRTDFGALVAASWVGAVRSGSAKERTMPLVVELMASCGSDDQRANLLLQLYGRVPRPLRVGGITPDELAHLRAQGRLFHDTGLVAEFVAATACTARNEWAALRPILEAAIQSLPFSGRAAALRGLVDGIYWAVQDAHAADFPPGLGEWLLDQLLLIPDFDDLGDTLEWRLEEVLKVTGRCHVSWLPRAIAARVALAKAQAADQRVRVLSHHVKLGRFVRRISVADVADLTTARAIEALLPLLRDRGNVGYHLPDVLRDVNPAGLVVPAVIGSQLRRASNAEEVRHLAHIGGAFVVGTDAWRAIAGSALTVNISMSVEERRSIFRALCGERVKSWFGDPGEVPATFASAVRVAKQALDAETDAALRPFWEWRVSAAEGELRSAEEWAKEERGE